MQKGPGIGGTSQPCEKQGRPAGHGQVQAGVQGTSEWVGWGISEVMLGHQDTVGQDQAWSYHAGPQGRGQGHSGNQPMV